MEDIYNKHTTVDTRANRCLVPEECQTCDEVCAKKEGKSGKNDYKPSEEESKKTYECDHDCDGWPYQNCWVAFHSNNFTVLAFHAFYNNPFLSE